MTVSSPGRTLRKSPHNSSHASGLTVSARAKQRIQNRVRTTDNKTRTRLESIASNEMIKVPAFRALSSTNQQNYILGMIESLYITLAENELKRDSNKKYTNTNVRRRAHEIYEEATKKERDNQLVLDRNRLGLDIANRNKVINMIQTRTSLQPFRGKNYPQGVGHLAAKFFHLFKQDAPHYFQREDVSELIDYIGTTPHEFAKVQARLMADASLSLDTPTKAFLMSLLTQMWQTAFATSSPVLFRELFKKRGWIGNTSASKNVLINRFERLVNTVIKYVKHLHLTTKTLNNDNPKKNANALFKQAVNMAQDDNMLRGVGLDESVIPGLVKHVHEQEFSFVQRAMERGIDVKIVHGKLLPLRATYLAPHTKRVLTAPTDKGVVQQFEAALQRVVQVLPKRAVSVNNMDTSLNEPITKAILRPNVTTRLSTSLSFRRSKR